MLRKKLNLSEEKITRARELASVISEPVQDFIDKSTTTTVERATLRMLGVDGVDADDQPIANVVVDGMGEQMAFGVAKPYINALLKKGFTPDELSKAIADGLNIHEIELTDFTHIQAKADELIKTFADKVRANVQYRDDKIKEYNRPEHNPKLYIIVASGNIYEDVKQAESAAELGVDIIAVIRATAQSLLDFVPYGPTTEGFGGTYATQENLKIMRAALDKVCDKQGRYISLVNYCSGLCMPEIAVMGAFERLDMMLNDSMYGILFRDINMFRTFVDQKFSRMVNTFADVIINTGEDNYLTTSDAFESAYTVLASQFINEKFAYNAGMPARLMGLGHAFEMDPEIKNGFLYELSQAQMAREIFPEAPLKYMPPTKHMTGNVFMGHTMNAMFNFTSKATGQSIHLLGMLTEALHTPYMQDRYLAIESAKYVMNNMEDFYEEIEFKKGGLIIKRAEKVLNQTIEFLEKVEKKGMFDSIEEGLFAEMKRPKDRGKGVKGVIEKAPDYWNPAEEFLTKELGIN